MSLDLVTIVSGPASATVTVPDAAGQSVTVTPIGYVGPTGSTGAQGPAGPPGESGAVFVYTQAVAATVWTIAHNLGVRPTVVCTTVGGLVLLGDVLHLSANTCTITFNTSIAGFARCV